MALRTLSETDLREALGITFEDHCDCCQSCHDHHDSGFEDLLIISVNGQLYLCCCMLHNYIFYRLSSSGKFKDHLVELQPIP